jgi:hypothetical protein
VRGARPPRASSVSTARELPARSRGLKGPARGTPAVCRPFCSPLRFSRPPRAGPGAPIHCFAGSFRDGPGGLERCDLGIKRCAVSSSAAGEPLGHLGACLSHRLLVSAIALSSSPDSCTGSRALAHLHWSSGSGAGRPARARCTISALRRTAISTLSPPTSKFSALGAVYSACGAPICVVAPHLAWP